MLTPTKSFFTCGGFYICANFDENRSRNATMRVPTDGYTHWHMHRQTQTGFIIGPKLYAIAVGQITIVKHLSHMITGITLDTTGNGGRRRPENTCKTI